MVVTGLEIGGIVVGCVNAGLGAAKLIADWRSRRADRKKEEKNQQLELSLRSDASTIRTAYSSQLSVLRGNDQRRFEAGDDQSRAEIKSSSEKLRKALKDLRIKVKGSKARVVPELGRFLTTSRNARIEIVESLVRLQKRITESSKVPRSLNPLRMFGLGKAKKPQKEPSTVGSKSMISESIPLIASGPTPNVSPSKGQPDPMVQFLQQETMLQPLQDTIPIRTCVSSRAPHPLDTLCLSQALQPACACNTRQVLIVDKMYVNGRDTGAKPDASHRLLKPKKKKRKPVATEIVLVRRPVRSK